MASLVLGGLLAPLSHFSFMALSDVFHHEGHTAMDMSGVSVGEESDNFVCEYANLLATQTLGSEPVSTCENRSELPVEIDDVDRSEQFISAYLTSANLVRGPPYS